MNKRILFFLLCSSIIAKYSIAQVSYPADTPGKAMVKILSQGQTSLENNL